MSYELLCHLSNALRMHVIGVEYPGYGVYGGQSNEKRILQDAESVYDYLINQLKITEDQIILFGRSIGTGPATWLASEKKVGALLLMSGYTSIRQVAKSIAGKFLMYFIKDRFRNIDWIKKVTVPVFIVHGQSDTLIPYQHSLELHRNCKGPNSLLLPENMNHNEFDFFDDLTIPFSLFLSKFGLNTDFESPGRIEFPSELFSDPSSM
jgi:pimeloyl-ACP methyl ester carboxylesterase